MDFIHNPDPALPLYIEKYETGKQTTPPGGHYLLYHLFDGRLYCKSAQGIAEQQAACCLLVPPGAGARVRFAEKSRFYRLLLTPGLFTEYSARFWEQEFLLFFREKIQHFALSGDKAQHMQRIMEEMSEEIHAQQQGYRELIRLKLSELFILLARVKTFGEPAVDIYPSARNIREIFQYLENHYTEPLTLNSVAEYAGYNPAYFSRYFKKATGVCLFAYINKIRVHKACRLLKLSDKSILEIALSVGYNNISFFNRCFRKIMNVSPLEFRKGF